MKFKLSLISFLLIAQVGFAASSATCFDTDTKIMLHQDGADASTTFTDSSASARTFTARASAQLDTAQFKFGTASGLYDSSSYIDTPANADFDFGTGDFTIDFWYRSTAGPANGGYWYGNGHTSGDFEFQYVNGTLAVWINGVQRTSPAFSFTNNTWQHVAVTRSGTDLRVFVDGTQQGATVTNSSDITGSNTVFTVGSYHGGSNFIGGWIDEFRVVKGTAVWTANFTPPTAAYDTNCSASGATFTQSGIGFGNYQIA